jgi:hypothetical protein
LTHCRNLTRRNTATLPSGSAATIEVLRLTGIRCQELLELAHHSITEYRLPSTVELVPLLQIVPSKTDTKRLLLVSPELADVLPAITSRVRGPVGMVPLMRHLIQLQQVTVCCGRGNVQERSEGRSSIRPIACRPASGPQTHRCCGGSRLRTSESGG